MEICVIKVRLWTLVVISLLPAIQGLVYDEIYIAKNGTLVFDIPYLAAEFGPSVPYEGIKGLLVYSSPEEACTPVKPPPTNVTNIYLNWLLLVKRHSCNYEVKVRHAQAAGYQAVIVHNVNSSELVVMGADNDTGINIPAVFIGSEDGYIMKDKYLYDTGFHAGIGRSNDFPISPFELLIIFSSIVGTSCLGMLACACYNCIRERRRRARERLPPSSLRNMPVHVFMENDPYETCTICLEQYKKKEKMRILPCLHAYHKKCIDPWLLEGRRVCPVCKRRVDGQATTESDTDDEGRPLLQASSLDVFRRERINFFRDTTVAVDSSTSASPGSVSLNFSSTSTPSLYTSASGSSPSSIAEVAADEDVRSLIEEPSVNV